MAYPPLTVPPAVIVHGLIDLRTALAAATDENVSLTVISMPNAAASAGALWFRALIDTARADYPAPALTAVLDCADQPGHALGALRVGLRHLLLTGCPDNALARLGPIAETYGAALYGHTGPLFDPRSYRDSVRACRDWLAVHPWTDRPGVANAVAKGY